jgi:hypothetical protein
MLHITVDGTTYDYDDDKLLNTEAIAIQKVTGKPAAEWGKALGAGDVEAVTALVWLVLRRNGQADLKFSEVEFDLNSISVRSDDEDQQEEEGDGDDAGDPPVGDPPVALVSAS